MTVGFDVEYRARLRHSAAHVMADVVKRMYKGVRLAIGPPTAEGFYYDFMLEEPFKEEDLAAIEEGMKEIIAKDLLFEYREYSRDEALRMNAEEELKLEIISEIPEGDLISTFGHGDFEDLCKGPHVESTGKIVAFKLLSVAGAYWRGDEKRPMLQRIYGTAFETQEALDGHLKQLEEAKMRDHRVLGRELDLFSVHEEVGPGLIIWHPKGALVRNIFENFWKREHYERGYDLIYTPNIGRSDLWQTSGHLDFFADSMFRPSEMDGQDYYLKPMNCPFHIMYYKSKLRSYRDLPMRIGELGTVYRYERGGTLHGMLRARGFTQDDAHIFCTPDQVVSEINGVLDLTFYLLEAFGFNDFEIMLSTKPEKAVGSTDQWQLAEEALETTLNRRNLSFQVEKGGGAFYGPKIDVHIRDAIGRLWQCTTVQFDFNLPQRFGLNYIDDTGRQCQPYMVHRAIFGSLERFMGILIEHYGGVFPIWLAPVQAEIIPIADRHNEYADEVRMHLVGRGLRAHSDTRNERMGAKIREAQMKKIPYMMVVGDRELSTKQVSVRLLSGENLGPMDLENIVSRISTEDRSRSLGI